MLTDERTGRPLPEITDQTRPFWEAARRGKLAMQRCTKCATLNFFPKPWCIECGCRALEWTEVRPTGTVYSYTIAYKVMMNSPGWRAELPVVMCIIDLDDGARMYGRLVGCAPDAVCIGLAVSAGFDDLSPEVAIPTFRVATRT